MRLVTVAAGQPGHFTGAGVYATILAVPVLALRVLDGVLPREAPRVAVRMPRPRSGRASGRTGQRGSRPARP